MRKSNGVPNFNLSSSPKRSRNIILAPLGLGRETKEAANLEHAMEPGMAGLADKADVSPISLFRWSATYYCPRAAMKPKCYYSMNQLQRCDPEMVGDVLRSMQNLAKEGMTMVAGNTRDGICAEVKIALSLMMVAVSSKKELLKKCLATHKRTYSKLQTKSTLKSTLLLAPLGAGVFCAINMC